MIFKTGAVNYLGNGPKSREDGENHVRPMSIPTTTDTTSELLCALLASS